MLKVIFVRPFTWYASLTLRKKIFVGIVTCISFCLLVLLFPVFLFFAVSGGMFGKMPSDSELLAIKSYQASEVYSADSVLLGRYFVENRSDTKYRDVSKHLFDAIIATEDARFYKHTGVDTRSLLRVLFKSILLRQQAGGGSTITQQLVKNLFGRKSYGVLSMPVNKIREAIIANQLEKLYSKEEILMMYVNTVSFGEDTYGIKTAAQRFFQVNPDKLKLEQAAVLAGMLKSPTYYNPRTRPDNALKRRNVVFEQMEKYKYLTAAEAKTASAQPLILNYNRMEYTEGLAPYFRDYLRTYVEQLLGQYKKADGSAYNLLTDGLKIYTTIQSDLQRYAESAAVDHLKRIQPKLQKELQASGFFRKQNELLERALKQTPRYQALEEQGLSEREIRKALQQKDSITMHTLWGEKQQYLSTEDSVKAVIGSLQTGMLVVNPHSGAVLAWVGGANYKQVQYEHVRAKRQAGSVFKPIVYAQALRAGMDPCEFIPNQEITYSQYDDWTPDNSSERENGRYSMAGALANSVNTISVQICMKAGIQNVISLARSLGIESELPAKPSIALGTADVSLWELVGAYTAFANNGVRTELQFITAIVNEHGKRLFNSKPSFYRVFTVEQAHQMTNMLCNVTDKGTAHELRDVYGFTGSIAAKTGTTQDHKDGWFMGYTAGLLAGVWVGADNPAVHFINMEQGRGSATAMPIWAGFYKRVRQDPEFRYLAPGTFPFVNDVTCEMYKDDTFIQKIFGRKSKTDNTTGLEETKRERRKKRKRIN
ncbi:MAG: transglycosylase domain-containing protein [Cytophaga sp.]|uniref:transglycosylase domain-containing protein n=1 Tax=Cytophaga sp. TaxID=29535 RepID=UPI003F7DA3A7